MSVAARLDDTEIQINLRARKDDRDLIDRAAAATHKTRTAFMLESARQAAIDTLLDQRFFALDTGQWDAFTEALNAPVRPNPRFQALMAKKAPWEN
jgi:uncharacterized protein (DUF1778 family)